MSRKIIVFGATGTLGTHIAIYLQQKGYQVYAVGHRKSDNGFFGDYNIPYYSLNIEDIEQFDQTGTKPVDSINQINGVNNKDSHKYRQRHPDPRRQSSYSE